MNWLKLGLVFAFHVLLASGVSALPDTLKFVDGSYSGHRFEGQRVAVFGGTSGIGFATAAMLVQECASEVVVLSRNTIKGNLAASVLANLSQSHCQQENFVVIFLRADIRNRTQVRSALSRFVDGNGAPELHTVVNTAGIAGWTGLGVADLPDDALLGEHDAVLNNLYGAFTVTQEAMRLWKLRGCLPVNNKPCPRLGYVPSLIHTSSEQGMAPCPSCEQYSASKHGIVGLTTSNAQSFAGAMKMNVVLPGLVNTPLTWNQVRGTELLANGTLLTKVQLQSWQCEVDGKVIDGECEGGGLGYGCPCSDISKNDPRIPKAFAGIPILDPRILGAAILDLSDPKSTQSGKVMIVDKASDKLTSWVCEEDLGKSAMWTQCPSSHNETSETLPAEIGILL